MSNGNNKKDKIINNTFNHTSPDIPFVVSSPINASRDEIRVFVMEICLLIKACNREKRTMIRYVINQDGQTARTDYTDANIF